MTIKSALFITALFFLCGCSSTGYDRSYIISDGDEKEVFSESVEKHY